MKTEKRQYIETKWELRTYDVWGNAKDGFEVNDTFRQGTIDLKLEAKKYNAGTSHEFLSASPTDKQLRAVFGTRAGIETDGDDMTIYVRRTRDDYPLGEIYCTSHESLSPIREAKKS